MKNRLKQTYSIQEFFRDRKIFITDLDKLSLENLFKNSIENQNLIQDILTNSDYKENKSSTEKFIFVEKKSDNNFLLLSNKIKILNLKILVSAIFNILEKRGSINNEHHEIFQNIMKDETLYHLELQDSDNSFFKDFIINRIPPRKNIKLTNLSVFMRISFYSFCEELEEMELVDINNLLQKITNHKFSIQYINLN